MKARVLFPTGTGRECETGDIIDVDEPTYSEWVKLCFIEPVEGKVERATAAPGEKRGVGRPRKAPEA